MKLIKKMGMLSLMISLVLSMNLIVLTAEQTIPNGPISSNKEDGINQIMQAGIMDEKFAEAIYDSFVQAKYFGNDTQNIQEILNGYNGKIDARNKGIKSIYGIEYLRNTSEIDFRNVTGVELKNEIRDLTPLSVEYLRNKFQLNEKEVVDWFREPYINGISINLSGNPISNYSECAGRMKIQINEDEMYTWAIGKLNAIKSCEKNWSVSYQVGTPEVYNTGKRVIFERVNLIPISINSDCTTEIGKLSEHILKVNGIKHSGKGAALVLNGIKDNIFFWKYQNYGSFGGAVVKDGISYGQGTQFDIRIYMPVVGEKKINQSVKLVKTVADTTNNERVPGAKYKLYRDNLDMNYENDELVSAKEYITNENGEFVIEEALGIGSYYLKEVEAPEGFLLNEEPVSFEIKEDKTKIVISGGDKNLDINAGDIQEDSDTVYIDRYSKNVEVKFEIDPKYENDPTYQLKGIKIIYFDRTAQELKTVLPEEKISSPDEAAKWATNWINANKGNDESVGIIDGEVKVQAEFSLQQTVTTSDFKDNPGKFTFTKVDNNEKPLEGASFVLYEKKCVDDHNQLININNNGDLTSQEDMNCWTLVEKITSDETGKIHFNNLNMDKEYRLIEYKAPDEYLLPNGQWKITFEKDFDDKYIAKIEKIGNPPAFKIESDGNIYLPNYKVIPIPITGSSGVNIFMGIGGFLMLLGGILYKKKDNTRKPG